MATQNLNETSYILDRRNYSEERGSSIDSNENAFDDMKQLINDDDGSNKSSLPWASFNFINSIIGSGVIGIPYALHEAGFFFGLFLLVLVAYITDYSLILMVRSGHISGKFSYQGIMEAAFGKPGYVLLGILQFFYPFIAMVSYNVVVGDTVTKVIIRLTGITQDSLFAKRHIIVLIATLLVTVPLCLYRKISKLAKISFLSLVCIGFILFAIFVRIGTMSEIVPPHRHAWSFFNKDIIPAIGIMAFAFMCHHNTFLIYGSMENANEKRWEIVTHISILTSLVVALLFGIAGYTTFTAYSQGDLLENYCWTDDLMNFSRLLFSIQILLTYPIECFVTREVITSSFLRNDPNVPISERTHYLITLAIVGTTYFISISTDCLGVVLELNALAAFCAHSVSISIGICQGYSAILIPQLTSSYSIHVDSEESSWLASLGAVTNPIGSILSGLLAEYFGRKRSIQISSVPFLAGWLCIALADNITWLYVGRLVTGIAAGMSSACYTYVSEISTPENRGILQSLGPICASFGILLTYTLGYFLSWSTVAFVSVSFSLFTLIAVEFLPESPSYLIKAGLHSKAFDSYFWFRRNVAVAQTEISKHSPIEKIESSAKEIYFSAATIKPFLILVTLFFLQQLSGIYTILFYAVNFFEETELELDNYVSSIILGVIRFAMSMVTAILVNKFGRRLLCMASSGGMSVTMLAMVVYFKYYEIYTGESRIFPVLPLICVILNVMFSMVGMLPIPWILVGELFPLEVRSIMSGIVICIAQCFVFLFVKIYPDMIHHLNFSGTLVTFLLAAVVALFFCKYVLPETKNKSLQEIEDYFKRKKVLDEGFCPEVTKNEGIFTVQIQNL